MNPPTADPVPPPRGRLRPALWLLVGLVLVDLVVVYFRDTWEQHSPDDYKEKLEACRSRPRDFVIAGGSPVSEGLIPSLVAGVEWRGTELQDGYQIGLSGATTSETYHAVLHGCPTPPRLLVYGITASDIATAGLGVRRAMVLGQILPGVPVWRLGPESRYPGMPYIVFPGNVGGPEAVAEVVRMLRGPQSA